MAVHDQLGAQAAAMATLDAEIAAGLPIHRPKYNKNHFSPYAHSYAAANFDDQAVAARTFRPSCDVCGGQSGVGLHRGGWRCPRCL